MGVGVGVGLGVCVCVLFSAIYEKTTLENIVCLNISLACFIDIVCLNRGF